MPAIKEHPVTTQDGHQQATVLAAPAPPRREGTQSLAALAGYLLVGAFFGLVLIKSEAASWYRIQEMFRFQSVHMYGFMGSALAVAALSISLIRRLSLRTLRGEAIHVAPKAWGRGYRYGIGGVCFGIGWALLSTCPGPVFALLGSGVGVMAAALLSAVAGTWVYGALRPRLPH
jgi:uncharacterized membrane protein YedE/YeeE